MLVNTCSVREKAQEKVFSLLGEWRLLKLKRPHVLIGVGGCVASQEGDGIRSRAPFVDLVFGPQTLHRLPAMLEELERSGRTQVDVSFPEIEKFDRLPEARAGGADGVRVDHGGLQQVLHASAWCPTRAARRSAGPSSRCSPRCASSRPRACAR